MTQEELTDINALFGGLSDDNNTNANNYDIIIRNQTSGNAMKVPVAIFKQVVYNYLTSASVAAGLASVLGVPVYKYVSMTIPANSTWTYNLGGAYHVLFANGASNNASTLLVTSYRVVKPLDASQVVPLAFSMNTGVLSVTNTTNETINGKLFFIV